MSFIDLLKKYGYSEEYLIKFLESKGYKVELVKTESFSLKENDKIFYINPDGTIDWDIWKERDGACRGLREMGNIYGTEEDARFAVERRKVRFELYKRAIQGPIEWDDNTSYWHLVYNITTHELFPGLVKGYITDDIFFKSSADVQRAIDAVGEDRILKYMMGVVR